MIEIAPLAAAAAPLIKPVFDKICDATRDTFINAAIQTVAGKAKGEAIARLRPARVPVNHDLAKALRRSWLHALVNMASDLDKRHSDPNFSKHCRALIKKAIGEQARWRPGQPEAAWVGLGASELLGIYESAGTNIGSMSGRTIQVSSSRSVADLAMLDIADLLEIDDSLIPAESQNALIFGWHGAEGFHKLFDHVVMSFLVKEIKTEPNTASSYSHYILQAVRDSLDGLKDISLQVLSATTKLDSGLGEIKLEMEAVRLEGVEARIEERTAWAHQQAVNESVNQTLSSVHNDIKRLHALDAAIGHRLTLSEKAPTPDLPARQHAASSTASWRNLRLGLYAERPWLLDEYLKRSQDFIDRNRDPGVQIPLLWIEGRSGDGKSVVLLQLAEKLLKNNSNIDIAQVHSELLPDWLAWASQLTVSDPLPIALVDDLSNPENEHALFRRIKSAHSRQDFRAIILTSGWTSQRQLFGERYSKLFEIATLSVPVPAPLDRSTLAEWLGLSFDGSNNLEGERIVETTFSLTRGSPETFAETFWKNTRRFDLHEHVKIILGLNSADVASPAEYMPGIESEALSQFFASERIDGQAISAQSQLKLFHGRVAWLLLAAECPAKTPLARFWAQSVHCAMRTAGSLGNTNFIERVLRAVGSSVRFKESVEGHKNVGTFHNFSEELYLQTHDPMHLLAITQAMTMLPATTLRDIKDIVSEKVRECFSLVSDHPSQVAAIATNHLANLLRENQSEDDLLRLSHSAMEILCHDKIAPFASIAILPAMLNADFTTKFYRAINAIASHSTRQIEAALFYETIVVDVDRFGSLVPHAVDWFEHFIGDFRASAVLQALLHADYSLTKPRALRWLDRNAGCPQASVILQKLWKLNIELNRRSGSDEWDLRNRALQWLHGNSNKVLRCNLLAELVPAVWADNEILHHAVSTLKAFPTEPDALTFIQVAIGLPSLAPFSNMAACRWLAANPSHAETESLFNDVKEVADDGMLVQLFKAWLANPGLIEQTFALAVDLLARSPTNPLALDLAARWVRAYPTATGVPLLLETLSRIPAATQRSASLLLEVAPKINDSQIRRDLIWSVIREQRVVRGGHKEICELITEQVASEDISFMSRHFLQAVSGIDGAKSILLAGLRKRHAYSKDVPFIIFEMLSTDAPSTRLLQSASEWLANYGHASGSFRIAKLLIEHAERLVKEEALVELSELSDANVIIKNLWNWCNLVGPDGMAAPIVISLLQGNLPTNIDSTVAAMDWLRTSESHRTANVWEAVFDKMRRCHTKKSVGEASLQGAEDVAQEWLALNPHHPVAPAVIMLVCGLDYRVHPLGQGGYVANFNNRTWKLALLQEWLDRNPLLPGATFVLVTALKTKGIRRHIVAMAREWLSKQNAGELSVNFIELLIDEAASAIAKDKLARLNNKERTAAKQFSAQLRTAAVDWIVENCAHKGAGYLVGAFLAKAELLDDVIDFARSWIATNATNSTMSFAVMRLAEVSSEASDVDLVKNWLRERGEDNGASFVLTICLSQKTAAVFATTAIDWIDIHVDHPGVGSVLTALAKSNHGSAEFLVASLKRHIGELTPPAVRQFFFAFNLWVEDNYIKKHSVEISKDTRRALAEYVSLFADSIPPFGERDVHTIRCCVGTSFWSEELGIPHDRSDLRLGFESLASDLGSGRWLEMNLKRPNYSDLVAPVASKWVQNFPSEIFISYLVVPLLHMPATFPEIRRVVFEIVRSRTKLQGMPHVVQALLETDMSAEAVAIVEEWVQSSESVDGWTYLADLLVAHPGDVRKSLESLLYASLKSAGKRGLGDVGLPGVVVKTLYRFGWSPILEELVQAILMIGGHVSEHFVHSLQTISQHSRDRQIQLIVLRIFVRYVRRHAPEHLALHVALPLLSDPKPLLDELEHAHSGATVLAFTRPLLNAAAKDEHLLKLLLDWLNGSGRLWRRTLRIPVVEIAVRNPSFLRLIDEVLSNSVLIIDDKVRGNCEEAIRRAHSVRFRAASIKQPRILRAIARRFSRLFWWPSSH